MKCLTNIRCLVNIVLHYNLCILIITNKFENLSEKKKIYVSRKVLKFINNIAHITKHA